MEVIFGNLPRKMSAFEIRRMVSSAILPRGIVETTKSVLMLSERIKRLEFKIVTEIKAGQECRYGIATIEPDKAADRIIDRLKGSMVQGQRLTVREYTNRSYSNDRRNVNWRDVQWRSTERRHGERRVPSQSTTTS